MRTIAVITLDVFVEHPPQLSGGVDLLNVDRVVFERPEESFRPCVVETLPFAVHRDFHIGLL